MMLNRRALYVLLATSFVVFGCNSYGDNVADMTTSEKQFNEEQKGKLLAYMDLDVMFPDAKLRELAKAAGKGKIKAIDSLIGQGINVNDKGALNATALFWALKKQNIEGFKKLLELGADPNVRFGDGGTVMHWAARGDDYRFLKAALSHNGDPNLIAGQFEQSPIFETIGIFGDIGNNPALDALLASGADVDMKRSNGDTPIIVAAKFGRFDIVHNLLRHGASPSLENEKGETLEDIMATKEKLLDPNHELFAWLNKVKKTLN